MFITKPKIFISSTIVDLPSERKAALNAVEKTGGIPLMSEFTMEAVNKDSVTACLDKVKSSDIYVLILGGRFGWQPEGKESITELEYYTAVEKKLPIIVFNTTYPKEQLQKEFERKVESKFFRKTVTDAFDLESEMSKSLEAIIKERQQEFFNRVEPVYSNLAKVSFPKYLLRAELNIDKKDIKDELKERGEKMKFKPSLFDFAVTAMRLKGIRFPGDWILWENAIYTFHDLQDSALPLSKIIDQGTAEKISCTEFYSESTEALSNFKYLLRRCLETKLHKKGIKWIKDEKLFAFIPIQKDEQGRWKDRQIEWSKVKKANRTVVDVKYNLKDNTKVYNLKCLAFRSDFHLLEEEWYLSIKPDWVFLWPDLKACPLAFENIQWLKRNERNIHAFNHFNFILRYLQPPQSEPLFEEFQDYRFLKIGQIECFDFAPVIPDEIWRNLESIGNKNKLVDKSGNIDLFQL